MRRRWKKEMFLTEGGEVTPCYPSLSSIVSTRVPHLLLLVTTQSCFYIPRGGIYWTEALRSPYTHNWLGMTK